MTQRAAIIHFRSENPGRPNFMKRLTEESLSIREKNRLLLKSNVIWENHPRKILIVHKETDLEFISLKVGELIQWIIDQWQENSYSIDMIGIYPSVLKDICPVKHDKLVYIENNVHFLHDIDLIVTLGGDGTVLLAAWLFQEHVPPIVPFHFGTLGFLTIFNWDNFSHRLSSILRNGSRFNTRMRLSCQITKIKDESVLEYNVLNEIVIERGASPFMSILDLFGDDKFLTKIQADGVAVATPTGSTAYSVYNIKTCSLCILILRNIFSYLQEVLLFIPT